MRMSSSLSPFSISVVLGYEADDPAALCASVLGVLWARNARSGCILRRKDDPAAFCARREPIQTQSQSDSPLSVVFDYETGDPAGLCA